MTRAPDAGHQSRATRPGPQGNAASGVDVSPRRALWLTLIAAAAAGAGFQQVVRHESAALGLSRLELNVVVALTGSMASRIVLRAFAARSGRKTARTTPSTPRTPRSPRT